MFHSGTPTANTQNLNSGSRFGATFIATIQSLSIINCRVKLLSQCVITQKGIAMTPKSSYLNKRSIFALAVIGLFVVMGATCDANALACSSPFRITELYNTAPFLGGGWTVQPVIGTSTICSPARATVDGSGGTHVYAMDE